MKVAVTTALLVSAVAAFPAAFNEAAMKVASAKLASLPLHKRSDPLGVSQAESNCGPTPCTTFNAQQQYISTTGEHAYQSPAASDIRGPCPGLNAAANHGYLPRNGIATIAQTVSGLGELYGLSDGLSGFLAAYAIAIDGNVAEGVWSIGGPLPPSLLITNPLSNGQGISYSHNNYEGDASIGRNDIYPSGDAHSLNVTKFEAVYAVGGSEDRYTLDKFRQRFGQVQDDSIAHNPYYFTGAAFSTFAVVPAAYNFVINFMSNHSAAEPSGYLDGAMFKTFFGITGSPGSFKWIKGQEKIPNNWYRRSLDNDYSIPAVLDDVAIGYLAYPKNIKFGGNTGKVNTFTGVNLEDITGGVLNAETLFQGDNFACFTFQLAQQAIPDFLKGPLEAINAAQALLNQYITPYTSKLQCPQLGKFDQGLFNVYPGKTYSPTGPATNYRA